MPSSIDPKQSVPHAAGRQLLWEIERSAPLPMIDPGRMHCRLWIFPSFAPWVLFCVASHDMGFELRRGRWDHQLHHQRQLAFPEVGVRQEYREAFSFQPPDGGGDPVTVANQGKQVTVDGISCGFETYISGEVVERREWQYRSGAGAAAFHDWFDAMVDDLGGCD